MTGHVISCQLQDKSDKSTTGIQYSIDSPIPDQALSTTFTIKGWVVHPRFKITRVTVESTTKEPIAETSVNIHRAGVSKQYQGTPNSEHSGFQIEIETPAPGFYSIVSHSDSGHRIPLSELRIRKRSQRKLLFMHIAKAGGSTVNRFLASHYPKSRVATHIESNKKWIHNKTYVNGLHFISGHVNLVRLNHFLSLEDYYKITVVREPYSHVISHLAWIRKLSDQGEENRFQRHPEYIQVFSRKLLNTNLSNPGEIKHLIKSLNDQEKQLVDNCQVRYFTRIKPGLNVTTEHTRLAKKASKIFNRIGTLENLQHFFDDISRDFGWHDRKVSIAENVSDNYYGLVNDDADIFTALHPLVKHDISLYRFIAE